MSALLMALYGKGRVLNACGSFSIAEAPALMKKLSLAIGVDTGLIYMADALGVPVIDIAGPCNMKNQRPMGKNSFIVQKKDMVCVPCSHTFKTPYKCRYNHRKCVTGITVDEVFACALKALQH
jgi:ADP-heptose:LPS heptosyltransferase